MSKPDLVSFLEQKKEPWSVKRKKRVTIHPGKWKWMRQMTEVRSTCEGGRETLNCGGSSSPWKDTLLRNLVYIFLPVTEGHVLSNIIKLLASLRILLQLHWWSIISTGRARRLPWEWEGLHNLRASAWLWGLCENLHVSQDLNANPFVSSVLFHVTNVSGYL